MAENPLELLLSVQRAATRLAADTVRTTASVAVQGVTRPDELAGHVAGQLADLAGTVAGLAEAVTGLAGSTAQPLQDFVVRQRELADTVATLAEAQAELAGVVAKLAERHADAVAALETVTAPVFALAGTTPTPPKTRAAKKSAAARKS
ncbi:MAG: hypothetical protein FWE71_12690 [Nocardioidaceae bacterium]|nr:hypothetical protein [Nocardioidaceae bacterium]MCL2613110.1 hypothetical protein [Nocardioidaceae bacterium]